MISVDTKKMTIQIDQWVSKSKRLGRRFASEFIQDISQQVVENTPVKTGFLRGSWHVALNAPPTGPGVSDPSGTAVVGEIVLASRVLKLGDVYYMSNGAAYAMRVEYGFVGTDSLGRNYNQAPRAFVRSVLDRARQIAEETAERIATTGGVE